MLFWHFFQHLIFSPRAGALIRRISWLSVTGIFLSVTAFLVVMFVMSGMNGSIERRVLALEPHLVFSSARQQEPPSLESFSEALLKVSSAEEIRQVSSFESQDVILRTMDGQFRGAVARGIDEKALDHFRLELRRLKEAQSSSAGTFDTELWVLEDSQPVAEGEILIGADLARSLGVFEGDMILVLTPDSLLLPLGEVPKTERVRVRRIFSSNLADLDSQFLFYDKGKTLGFLSRNPNVEKGFEVWLKEGRLAESIKKKWISTELSVQTWTDRNSALFFALLLEKSIIAIFLGLAGFIATSSVLTVMALLLSQKRRDLVLLRVLGLSAEATEKVFTQLGLCLAGAGILAGVVMGTAIGLWIEAYPLHVLPDIYYDSEIPARVEMGWVFLVLLGAGVLSFLGAWIPSRVAARQTLVAQSRQIS